MFSLIKVSSDPWALRKSLIYQYSTLKNKEPAQFYINHAKSSLQNERTLEFLRMEGRTGDLNIHSRKVYI